MDRNPQTSAMKDLQGFFREGERERIYRTAEKIRDKVLIRLLWKSGRRISEVLALKVHDIDFENKMIHWTILKKKLPTMALKPIDSKTLQLLEYFIVNSGLQPDHYLINNGNPYQHLNRKYCFEIIRKLCKKAGIEKVGNKKPHPHHFRHSFAIDLVKKAKSGSGIRIVQQALEHSSLQMTEQYLQFSPEELRELIEE